MVASAIEKVTMALLGTLLRMQHDVNVSMKTMPDYYITLCSMQIDRNAVIIQLNSVTYHLVMSIC